jgi:hypothetical protein
MQEVEGEHIILVASATRTRRINLEATDDLMLAPPARRSTLKLNPSHRAIRQRRSSSCLARMKEESAACVGRSPGAHFSCSYNQYSTTSRTRLDSPRLKTFNVSSTW